MRTIMGRTSMSVEEELERGCPHLPLGCTITLEKKAKEYIMQNIKGAIKRFTARKISSLVMNFERNHDISLTLSHFINLYKVPVHKLYRYKTWNQWLYLLQQNKAYEKPDNSLLENFLLKLHGVHTKSQIQVAIGTSTLTKKSPSREGVERNKNLSLEAMFVDIVKNREEGYTIDYDDKALSPYLFQWDTQNRVKPESKEGQAYIHQMQTMLLFVREQKTFYKNLGTRKQMQIVWKMVEPIPGSVMHFARIREIA